MSDRVIVTGSEGLIGKVLCERLEKLGVDVIRIDRKIGREAKDIREYIDNDVRTVFHLAAQTSVFNKDLQQIVSDNISTFIEVVKQCNEHGIKLVYASSSTAFNGNTTSLYGLSKRFDEEFARLYAKNATGIRLHNVYGKEQREGTLLYSLMTKKEVTLYNSGENIRCFTYIDDAADGIISAASCSELLMNLVNNEPIKTIDFSREVSRYNGVKFIPVSDSRERDNKEQVIDTRLPIVELPYTGYKEGIKKIFS